MKYILIFILLTITIFASPIQDAKKLFDDDKKYKDAIEIFQNNLEDGEAQYYIGKAYLYGMGIEKDEKKAFGFATKSGNQNNSAGLNLLGVLYADGKGIEKDIVQSMLYYQKAAKLGNAKSMRNIAFHYYYLEKYDESILWFNKAIENGAKEVYSIIGEVYQFDIKDYTKALEYYKEAIIGFTF